MKIQGYRIANDLNWLNVLLDETEGDDDIDNDDDASNSCCANEWCSILAGFFF